MFKKLIAIICVIVLPSGSYALLNLELTQGVAAAIPVAITPFTTTTSAPEAQSLGEIISADLKNSGQFAVKSVAFTPELLEANTAGKALKQNGVESLLLGDITRHSNGSLTIHIKLLAMQQAHSAKVVLARKITIPNISSLRRAAHHISDQIYQTLTGVPGVFSTKIAYVAIESRGRQTIYRLETSDQDGFNARTILTSSQPIMSPAWSPDGKQIAYVSFEKQHAAIYIQNIVSGARHLISEVPGINGAPAFAPDGKKLAVVLSKSGSPNVYIMDIASKQLKTVTQDYYINTEPAWSPDGKKLLFTSNRSGGPQIYLYNLNNGYIERLSFNGNYNARASFTPDGEKIIMIHRVDGRFNIAVQDLQNGQVKILSNKTTNSASPSLAPNGMMVLYDVEREGKNELAMASVDGRIQIILPARSGSAQDAAWAPFAIS